MVKDYGEKTERRAALAGLRLDRDRAEREYTRAMLTGSFEDTERAMERIVSIRIQMRATKRGPR